MRRLLLLGASCAVSVLALAPASWATSYAVASCAEMPTQELAQGTLDDPAYGTNEAPGVTDPLDLDPDGDGVACNDPGNLVGGEAPEPPTQYGQPEAPEPGRTADEYQYPPQNDLTSAEGAEEAARAADVEPADARTLNGAIEAAGAARDGGIAPAAASEAGASRAAEGAVVPEEQDAAPGSAAGEEEAEAYGGIEELPATGGVSPALGACTLLVAGGLAARRIVG